MLNRPSEISAIFSALSSFHASGRLPHVKAIGAKIRLGHTVSEHESDKVYLPVLDSAVRHLDYLAVHPRNSSSPVREQPPDYAAIREMKEQAGDQLMIVGNADVACGESYRRMLGTGCDAVMVARGAINNPWIFRHLLDEGARVWPTSEEVEEAEESAIEMEEEWAQYNREGGGIKNKYVTFREIQFRRLRHFVKTGVMLDVTRSERVRAMKKNALQVQRRPQKSSNSGREQDDRSGSGGEEDGRRGGRERNEERKGKRRERGGGGGGGGGGGRREKGRGKEGRIKAQAA